MRHLRFNHVLVALVAITALTTIVTQRDIIVRGGDTIVSPLSITRVDNLVATGTIDSTGEVIARAGVRLTAPTTGPIFTSGTGVPAGAATKGSLFLRTDTAQVYQNTDGATAWSQVGVGGVTSISFSGGLTASPNPITTTGTASIADADRGDLTVSGGGTTWTINNSAVTLAKMADLAQATIIGRASGAGTGVPTALSASQVAAILTGQFVPVTAPSVAITSGGSTPGAVNFSTLGNIDWWATNSGPASVLPPSAGSPTAIHFKISGGWIANTFRWRNIGTYWGGFSTGTTYTSTGSDDMYPSVNTTQVTGVQSAYNLATAGNGLGFIFRVPATTTSRVLRIYAQAAGCDNGVITRTITATLQGAGTTVTNTALGEGIVVMITFNSSTADELYVSYLLTQSGGSSGFCSLALGGISLGTS